MLKEKVLNEFTQKELIKMKYKLICIDMDGTLLNDDKVISKENKAALKEAHDKGIHISVCTGRLFTSARNFSEMIGVKTPIIASNGAYIREKDQEKVIYQKILPKETCRKIYEIMKNFNVYKFFNTFDIVASEGDFPDWYTYTRFNEGLLEEQKVKLEVHSNFDNFIEEHDEILKYVAVSKEKDELEKARQALSILDDIEIVSSGFLNFEINAKGVSKGNAAKQLAEIYGIDRSEVICIGDSGNDLSMIQYAGIGIAMGNADEEIKLNADYITDTNNNNGVAKALRKFVL
jgi:Cof subfamily protein (haloacid dehalogenase superfamily)